MPNTVLTQEGIVAPPTPTPGPDRSPVVGAVMYAAGIAAIGYGTAAFLHRPAILTYAVAAAAAVAVIGSVGGAWHRKHTRPVRDLTVALAPVLRPETPTGMVRASRRRHGVPTKIVIRYPATWDERDTKARDTVRQIVATRLGGTVVATWQPPKRRVVCRIEVTPGSSDIIDRGATPETTSDDSAEQTRLRGRATSVVHSIMGATATVTPTFDGDTLTRVDVAYATTTRDLSRQFRNRALMQLDSKLPGEWRDVWQFEKDRVYFELRPPFPSNVRFPLMHKMKKSELPYAVAEDHSIVSWKLGSKDPHCLVIGPTGSGKTVFIRNLVVAARLLGIPVVLCDPKMTEYLDFEDMDGVQVVCDPHEIAYAITAAHNEMMGRYDLIKRRVAKKDSFSQILFILDEFFIFKEQIDEIWAEMKSQDKTLKGREHPCMSKWKRMVVLARTARIHMIVGIQRPDAAFLTGLARDSFRKRVSLDRATPEAARMMWGDSYTGTDLPSIQGRAITSTADGAQEVQVLRLLTPSDDSDYDGEDKATWETLVDRMQVQSEAYAKAHPGVDLLGFLGSLRSDRPSRGTGPAVLEQLAPPVEPAGGEDVELSERDQDHQSTADPAPHGSYESVGVYELEPGSTVLIDGEPVEITDMHFGDDDGAEWVEVDYVTSDGTEGTERLGLDDVLDARV
ncbi:putative DNA translocase (plasmid) [Actinacidiphila reveromycinica]|uniref:Putative DNA translocase n=1 Tax=Actinacidiphila reveromycinica TaxID=659352 RepID=A0A7U3V3F2_9ACTN|nr:FtsK/SpoIIIE domain-containing protein [Streptomyces sp. SN-593]BBG20758.1 putative DNA translocase [Streptomyces sp. SN-593]